MTLAERHRQLMELLSAGAEDFEKTDAGVHAAGVRVRKLMREIQELARTIRKEVLEKRNKHKPSSP